jgi:hypothetical protein
LYNTITTAKTWYDTGILAQNRDIESKVFHKWYSCFNEFTVKESNVNSAKICSETTIKLCDYISNLNRSVICIDDIRSVLTNKHKFRVIYTDQDTWLTKDPTFEPIDESPHALFEGL